MLVRGIDGKKIENGRSVVNAHQLQLSSSFFPSTLRASKNGTTELELGLSVAWLISGVLFPCDIGVLLPTALSR